MNILLLSIDSYFTFVLDDFDITSLFVQFYVN